MTSCWGYFLYEICIRFEFKLFLILKVYFFTSMAHFKSIFIFYEGRKGMEYLNIGMQSPYVSMLQLALIRSGFLSGEPDGYFCELTQNAVKVFQTVNRLDATGITGPKTWAALSPYLLGYITVTICRGDDLNKLAIKYNTSAEAIASANHIRERSQPRIGSRITVPLGFSVVPTNIPFTHSLLDCCVCGLKARYPFIRIGKIGDSFMGKPIFLIKIGNGENQVFYNGAHHGNEWITTPLLLKFIEDFLIEAAYEGNEGEKASILERTTLYIVPMVNPDGVDLVNGAIPETSVYRSNAAKIAAKYPDIYFPSGWKANILGVDLNLQYPAGWREARSIKSELGFSSPSPVNYPGLKPLSAPESSAVYSFTKSHNFSLTLSYHTQGEVIYWKYLDKEPPGAGAIAEKFGSLSGYAVSDTPFESGHAGYKDWFINEYNRPGFTIEAGFGSNPLPLSQFAKIYNDNAEILKLGLTITASF